MKVLLTKRFFHKDLSYIKSKLDPNIEIVDPLQYDEETLLKHEDVDVFLGAFVTPKLLSTCANLKLIQVPWTGVDRIDFETLRDVSVPVCNSHSNSGAVAEMSVALFLSLTKGIVYHDKELRKGNWNRPKSDQSNEYSPFSQQLKGMEIGILGYGAIGKDIHKMLSGFSVNMNILSSRKPLGGATQVTYFEKDKIDEFLGSIDCLFVCLPLTPETKDYLDSSKIKAMKKGSFIVNTARGLIINQDALFDALENNHIGGAAIDTWWNGPSNKEGFMPCDREFQNFDQVVFSPHRSGMVANQLPHLDDAIINLNNLVNDRPLINRIDLSKKY